MGQLENNTASLQAILEAVNALPEAGGTAAPRLEEQTVDPATTIVEVTPGTGYDGLSKVIVSAMPTAVQATPGITVNSSGLITASATQSAGYVAAGTKSATKQLTTKGAQTYTPGTSNQTIASGRYLTGTQTIKGDANLVAANIKSGVSIFGVNGSYAGSGGSGGGTGGGLPAGVTALACGSFTIGSELWAYEYEITHNLGVAPNFLIMTANTTKTIMDGYIAQVAMAAGKVGGGKPGYAILNIGENSAAYTIGIDNMAAVSNTTTIKAVLNNFPIAGGTKFEWVCGVMSAFA